MLLKEFPGGPSEYINRNEDRGRAVAARFFGFARDRRDAPDAVEALGWVASHLKGADPGSTCWACVTPR